MATNPHDFHECLAQSHAASDLPFWEETYNKAFPGMLGMFDHREDGPHQRAGIDRSIILATSRQVRVDEKVRGRNKITNRVYDDVALEFMSNDRRRTPGWVCKPLLCDYIAYAIAPLGKCYLLPVEQLQAAWAKYGEAWKRQYGIREAVNRDYRTLFTPVPVSPLFLAIGSMLRLTFEPCDVLELPSGRYEFVERRTAEQERIDKELF